MTRPAEAETALERSLPANLVQDQKLFWTSPARLQAKDLRWLVPFSMVTAGLIGADHGIESRHLPDNPNTIRRSKSFSNYGAVGFVGSAGAFYLWGRATDNAHMRETGWLSGEALLNGTAIGYAIKGITQRERPLEGSGRGNFWASRSPFNSSFPSEHAIAAWSIASVVAHEYPSPLTQFLAYGAASAVSVARVTGRQHWASDVLIGSALGWYMGRQVFRAHTGGEDRSQWGTFEPAPRETARDPAYMGSPYVPLDSWVYPMFDRLAALGLIKTAFFGLRPWTRLECARLVEEASANRADYGNQSDAMQGIYDALYAEFALERGNLGGERNLSAQIESVYTRFAEIAGPPIRDSYHFGQTIINDYGRPFGRGANIVTGFSSRAVAGPVAFYVRGEYQHAPGAPAYSDAVRNVIAGVDINPVQPALPISTANQFRLLDSYIAFNVHDLQFSIGKQSLWWGPGQSGPLLLSDNAEPMYMARIS
ncbi:MAG TPA: capsule assembly Wzi family protein, partial [Terriglobales bacterium]